ncbi:ATP-binding protein [Helicobacter suis]|uniref:ATP-binding protein n=1 Tax=Helicobacter suis TaxID=104628 RepID=UPI0013D0CFFE|nr:ATP-binding protein [Helicobacter suis]
MSINAINTTDYQTLIRGYQDQGRVLEASAHLELCDIDLYHIQELTFEKDSPRREAFENVISMARMEGALLVYLILGDTNRVSFFVGMARDKSYQGSLELDIDDLAKRVLKPSIEGNFRGSKVVKVERERKDTLLNQIKNMKRFARIDGVPSLYKDKENFQGIDRLIDIMSGDIFALLILAKPFSKAYTNQLEAELFRFYNDLAPMAKQSIQRNEGSSTSEDYSENKGVSEAREINDSKSEGRTDTNQTSKGSGSSENSSYSSSSTDQTSRGSSTSHSSSSTNQSASQSKTINNGTTKGSSTNQSTSQSTAINTGTTKGISTTNTTSKGETKGSSKTTNISETLVSEHANKAVSEWMKYLDEVLFKRLNFGRSKGLFHTCIYLATLENGNLSKLGRAIKAIFSGDENNQAPLHMQFLEKDRDAVEIEALKNFQISKVNLSQTGKHAQALRLLFSRDLYTQSSWFSTSELGVIATLPKKEVVGLPLREEVEFGLNVKEGSISEVHLNLGQMVQSGKLLKQPVCLKKSWLDKHIFVAGVTGSGKTTTCQSLLKSAGLPFLVIEPAKTEYRALLADNQFQENLLVFTLGNPTLAPFKLNPFEFFPHENITSRVGMIKANIEAAFDMEAAIPQIIEAALYECYKDYGWDINTNTNERFKNPFDPGVFAFPTLSDLYNKTQKIVEQQGFDQRLKDDYIGSINARLQGLLVGSKAGLLNNDRGLNFIDLLEKNVILELEEIKNGSEKSLIMGFILIQINEALKVKYQEYKHKGQDFKHITLIEEAHRLLSKVDYGDSPNKKLGVESFTDMLAEVRKYGESLIIVDQIPNKLTSEVLKNTNTKIVHRLFAQDDKEAIGHTMALEDEQKNFLSHLETGRVIISNPDFLKPIQVQITPQTDTSAKGIDIHLIAQRVREFYRSVHKSGVLLSLEHKPPSDAEIEKALSYDFYAFSLVWRKGLLDNSINLKPLRSCIVKGHVPQNLDYLTDYLMRRFYASSELPEKIKKALSFILDKVLNTQEKEINYCDHRNLHLKELLKMGIK